MIILLRSTMKIMFPYVSALFMFSQASVVLGKYAYVYEGEIFVSVLLAEKYSFSKIRTFVFLEVNIPKIM